MVVFVQKVMFSGELVVFGQNWLYSGKNCFIRAKAVIFAKKVVLFL